MKLGPFLPSTPVHPPWPSRRAFTVALGLWGLGFARGVGAAVVPPDATTAADLARRGLAFNRARLAAFDSLRVVANSHVNVRLAVRHPDAGLEIRYGWLDLSDAQSRKSDQAQQASVVFLTAVMNLTDPDRRAAMVMPQAFPPDAVREEFNADAGWTSLTPPRPTFARAGAALVNGIFSRKHATLAWSIYLYEPRPEGGMSPSVQAASEQAFHALRFVS